MARPLGEVGDDHKEQCAKEPGPDAVEQLDRNQDIGVLRQHIQQTPDRQDSEAGKEEGLATQASAFGRPAAPSEP